MANGGYMGSTDDAKRAWMQNLVAKLSAPMGVYMVSAADVSAISAAVDDFIAKLAVVQTPDGRNKTTTAQKNDARAGAIAICAQFVRLIKSNAGIDDAAKIAAGINPGNTLPEPRPCPLAAPGLSITAATNGAQTLAYSNPLEPTSRRKPLGAEGVMVFRAIADEPVTDIAQASFYRLFSTTPMPVFFDAPDNGRIATYFARWVGKRGDMSTPSAPVSMAIAA
jgi:hypothetical protein